MSSSSRRLYLAVGAGALLGVGPGRAAAANWELIPRIELGGSYNDNYRMAVVSADKLQVYGPYVDAQLNAHLLSERAKLEIVPRVRSDLYPSDHPDQSTDGYLTVDGDYKTLRSEFSALAQYSDETVIYSELLPATFPGLALGAVQSGVSGQVSVRNRRQLAQVAPAYTYELTQRAHLNLNAQVIYATFQRNLLGQVGFSNYRGSMGVGYDVSERSVLTVTGIAEHFVPQLTGQTTNRYGLNMQWDLRHSQIAHFYARVGVDRTQAQTPLGTISETGESGGVGVDLRYQITEVTADVLQAFAPSAAGAVIITDQARFRVLHAFAPLFSGFIGANGYRMRGQQSTGPLAITGEDYVAAEAGVDYQLTQSYRIEATYDLIWQRFQGAPSAQSNAVGLSIIYQPLSQYKPLPEFTGIPQEP